MPEVSEKPKRVRGSHNSITLSPYIQNQLEILVSKKHLSKSVIITLALEKYAREELGNDGNEK